MNEQQMRKIIYRTVSIVCDDLTDEEMLALTLSLQMEGNPKVVMGYQKAQSLFTEMNETKMHEETKRAFLSIASGRLEL